MVITWKGQSCFEIIANPLKNGQVKLVIDPYTEEIGLKLPKLEADIVLSTHNHYDHNNIKGVGKVGTNESFVIQGPGEYEVKNIYIRGISSWHDNEQGKERGENAIYTLEAEDLKICHLGDLGQAELTPEQLENIGEVDVLMIPVGGVYTIEAKEAIKVMAQIEPRITIPMHYSLPKVKVKLDEVDKFLKAVGLKTMEPLLKLNIKKKDLSQEEAKILILQP